MNSGLSAENFDVGRLVEPLRQCAEPERLWHPHTLAKGHAVFRQGDVSPHVFVLASGLIKLAYATASGAEWIKSFIVDRGVFGATDVPDERAGSRFSAVCIEECRIVRLPLCWVLQRIAEEPELGAAYAAFSAWVRRRKEAREEALLCLNAEERYRDFLSTEPRLASRLKQSDIARYLRVTPIALSRIRRRMGLLPPARQSNFANCVD